MYFLLKLYPPLRFKNGEETRLVEVDREEVKAGWILDEVLGEVNSVCEVPYRPEDVLVIVGDDVAGRENAVKSGQVVKIMLMGMGG